MFLKYLLNYGRTHLSSYALGLKVGLRLHEMKFCLLENEYVILLDFYMVHILSHIHLLFTNKTKNLRSARHEYIRTLINFIKTITNSS